MYDAVASSRSAVRVEQLSITVETSRPALRTEEAAEWRAPPVSSRASSSFLPADRPNSSIDSLASLPSSAAVSVTVLKVVTMFLQSLGWLACVYSNRTSQGTFVSIRIERADKVWAAGRRPAEAAKTALSETISALGRVRFFTARLFRPEPRVGQTRARCVPRSTCR